MRMRKLRPADYRVMPWKNGRGSTTELYLAPVAGGEGAGGEGADFLWRISVATIVESGAFSRFSGVDRIIIQLTGGKVTLTHEAQSAKQLEVFEPYAFSGDLATSCELDGAAAEDFNVMALRSAVTCAVSCHTVAPASSMELGLLASQSFFLHCLSGFATFTANRMTCDLADQESLLVELDQEKEARVAVASDDAQVRFVAVRFSIRQEFPINV